MKASNRALVCFCLLLLLLVPIAVWSQDDENGQDEVEDAVEAAEAIEESEAPVEPMVEEIIDGDDTEAESTDPEPAPAVDEAETEAADPEPAPAVDEAETEAADPEPAPAVDEAETEAADAEPVAEETVEQEAAQAQAAPDPEADTAPPAGAPETFILQGHPIFTPDQADLVYRPLVNYLNDVTPYRFDLQISRDFHRYWLDVRRGEMPDLVLEEAHLTAFRMQRDDYTPLVKAAEPMTYSLMASANYVDGTLRDFVGQPVSSMPSPSLGYLVLSRWYENPMQQPIIQSNASSWLDAIEIVFSMEAEAAMAPRNLAERYVNLETIETSREFPGLTLSASPAVPEEIQLEIRQALLNLHDDEDHFAAVHELDIERFIEADPQDYDGLEDWLREVTGFF